jgi:alcohol dehydrogenase class IV
VAFCRLFFIRSPEGDCDMQFAFATASDVRFGRGCSKDAASLVATRASKVILVHGRSRDRAAWLLQDLADQNIAVETVACTAEPDVAMVENAVAIARHMSPDLVVALGGGACVDLGKAISALTPAKGPTLAYLEVVGEGRRLDAHPLPFIAIPTTAGTGAEVTKNAVISVPAAGKKVSLRDPRMIPDIAIVDPALTDNAPPHVTFSSGFDAITQVIEPYLSTNASPMTDALCRDAIPRGLKAILRLADGENRQARDDLALTSLFGGIALANAGLGAVHGLAGVIGGRTAAPHGEICATLLPHVLAYDFDAVPQDNPARQRVDEIFAWIGDALGVPSEQAAEDLRQCISALGIRALKDLGLSRSDLDAVAVASQTASSSKTNPIPPEDVNFRKILDRGFG